MARHRGPADGTEALMSVEAVADRLGISLSKAYQLVRAGRIPHVRIDRSVRVPAEALEEWIKTRTEGRTS